MFRKMMNKQGFTLIELMIVIAIIGILAAIAIPNFISYRNKAYCSRAESDARSVIAAISSYFSEPENTSCGADDVGDSCPERLAYWADLTFDANNQVSVTLDTDVVPDRYSVWVQDNSGRCPRGKDPEDPANIYSYMAVMGGGETGGWVDADDGSYDPAPATFYTMTDLTAFRP